MSEGKPTRYEPIAVSAESTVVAEFIPEPASATAYQSEAELEREFIKILQSQAYEYLPITTEARPDRQPPRPAGGAERHQVQRRRSGSASSGSGSPVSNEGIVEKTVRIQEDYVQLLKRDDGTTKNITLIDKTNIHNNRLQVINQYEVGQGEGGAKHANRYDVTVLVNGLPLVHIELKRRGVDIREAFNQIDRYQRDSFWAGSGLFDYVQLFVISNGTLTKYYSNTTRRQHLQETARAKSARKKTSNSFEFTSWWADATNKPIQDLTAFAKTFFAKHTLLNILTRYCVLTADKMLLVMRPYQIVATERILQKIEISTNYKKLGTIAAGGYVWHTTGSGKTLTSFKAAQLATRMADVEKVLFVVDRKDLDYQTMREYDRFEKGAANSNTSTRGAEEAARGPGRADHHHDDPEARDVHRGEQGPRHLRRPRRDHLRRVPPLAVRRHAHRDHQGVQALPPVRLHRHADLRGQRAAATRAAQPAGFGCYSRRAGVRRARAASPTRSSTRSPTRTCCRSASTTSTRSRSPRASRTSRCQPSTPSERCSTRDRIARSSTTRWSTSTRRPGALGYVHADLQRQRRRCGRNRVEEVKSPAASRASTHCSPPRRSRLPSATTPSSPSSSRRCRRTAG